MLYYKIEKSSTLGQYFSALLTEMRRCDKAALDIMRDVGASAIHRSSFAKGGSIYCFKFDTKPDEKLWRRRKDGWYPKSQPDLIRKIETLPCVSVIDWSDAFKTDLTNQPGLFSDEKYFWIESNLPLILEEAVPVKLSEWALAKEKKEGVV